MKKQIVTAGIVMSMLAPSLKAQEGDEISRETKKTQHELVNTLNNDKSASNDVISLDDAISMKIEEGIKILQTQEKKDIKKMINYYGKEEFDNIMSNVVKDIINNPEKYGRFDKYQNYSMIDDDLNFYEQENLEKLIESRFDKYYNREKTKKEITSVCGLVASCLSAIVLIRSDKK